MHITKRRVQCDAGLVPAGRYFEQVSKSLRIANAREQTRCAEDRNLETDCRRPSPPRRSVLQDVLC